MTQKIRDQFTGILTRGFAQYISDQINERLKSAISTNQPQLGLDSTQERKSNITEESQNDADNSLVITTDEEIEGYRIIRAILRKVVDIKRVFYRDAQTYCAIILDDNNRKTICRLHFNKSKKYIGIIGDDKKETRYQIETLDDIYQYSDQVRLIVQSYLAEK